MTDGVGTLLRSGNANDIFKSIFETEITNSVYLFTNGSKMEVVPFAGFAITSLDESINFKT